jgi:hypothetical protein
VQGLRTCPRRQAHFGQGRTQRSKSLLEQAKGRAFSPVDLVDRALARRLVRSDADEVRAVAGLQRVARRIRRRPVLATVVAASTLLALVLMGGSVWLISQRAAGERAAEEDLREMVRFEEASQLPEAQAALDRAQVRIANGASSQLRARVDQGLRELQLLPRLDRIRLDRLDRKVQLKDHADEAYETAFVDGGLGRVGDDPAHVAARIRALPIRNALVAALDDWSLCFHFSGQVDDAVIRRADWVLGWRDGPIPIRRVGTAVPATRRTGTPSLWTN